MSKAFGIHQVLVGEQAISLGNELTPFKFGALLDRIGPLINHVMKFIIEVDLTPAYTTAPTVVQEYSMIKNIELFDGTDTLLQNLNGNDLRMFERLHNGGTEINGITPTSGGTGNQRSFRVEVPLGPGWFAGDPTDWALPVAKIGPAGYLKIQCGALLDYSADATTITGTYRVSAVVGGLAYINLPPRYELRKQVAFTSDQDVPGDGVYAVLGLLNSTSYDAFASGDLGRISYQSGNVNQNPIDAELIRDAYNNAWRAGIFGLMGEPRSATDAAQRMLNNGTPTALQARTADLQPVLSYAPDARITKLDVIGPLHVTFDGSQTTGNVALYGRFKPTTPQARAQFAQQTQDKLQIPGVGSMELKLLSKKNTYHGPHGPYLPHKIAFKRAA